MHIFVHIYKNLRIVIYLAKFTLGIPIKIAVNIGGHVLTAGRCTEFFERIAEELQTDSDDLFHTTLFDMVAECQKRNEKPMFDVEMLELIDNESGIQPPMYLRKRWTELWDFDKVQMYLDRVINEE